MTCAKIEILGECGQLFSLTKQQEQGIMYWQDPEVVLPEEGQVVVCQVLERQGLIKGFIRHGMWLDLNWMPIEVIKWKEVDADRSHDQESA